MMTYAPCDTHVASSRAKVLLEEIWPPRSGTAPRIAFGVRSRRSDAIEVEPRHRDITSYDITISHVGGATPSRSRSQSAHSHMPPPHDTKCHHVPSHDNVAWHHMEIEVELDAATCCIT